MIVDVHNLSTFEENFLAEIGNQKCSAIKLHIYSFVLCGFAVVYLDQHLDAADSKCWSKYNRDPKLEHSKTGFIRNPDISKVRFQMVQTIQ